MTATVCKLLYVVHLPPPIHGVAQVNRMVVDDDRLNASLSTRILEVRSSKDLAEIDALSLRKGLDAVRLCVRLISECVSFRPDFAYLSPVPTGPAFLRDLVLICILRTFGVKRLLHLHGLGIQQQRRGAWPRLYRLAFGDAAVISISTTMQQRELGWLSLPTARLYSVHNAVPDTAPPRPSRTDERAIRLLFLSATFRTKGVIVLLEAFRSLATVCPNVELEIVGSSSPAVDDEIAARIDEHGLRERVFQRGSLYGDAKQSAYARADVFVHPSLRDYFPLVLLEAMCSGLPIVSTRVGAIPEIVADGKTGLLCDANDAPGLAAAMEKLVLDHDMRRRCGVAARERYEREFSIERFSGRMREVFRAEGLVT
jgi:glycosyltransferase involved in cell wall biosynthesis